MYWDNLAHHDGGSGIDEIWLSHPLIRDDANRQVSGDPSLWPTQWFAKTFATDLPLRSVAVIGGGTGGIERALLSGSIAERVTSIEIAAEPLRRAAELAVAAGVADRITHVHADAFEYLRNRREEFDAAFFHASLHHFEPFAILTTVRNAMKEGALLFADEYVGPSRNQWTPLRLLIPNLAYRLLPYAVRRPHLIRAPINREDETEAMASHAIVPAIRQLFRVEAMRPYGGNLLALLYPNLHRPPAVSRELFDRSVRRIMAMERRLLSRRGAKPFYAVIVARKNTAAE